MEDFRLKPNEHVVVKETGVAVASSNRGFLNELILTNRRLVCIERTTWANKVRGVREWSLSQIRRFNGAPQVSMGKFKNGTASLDVYLLDGTCESFRFNARNKERIRDWTDAIVCCAEGREPAGIEGYAQKYDSDTIAGAFKEIGSEFADIGKDFLGEFGIPVAEPESIVRPSEERVSCVCSSCGARLSGPKGQTVTCDYCGNAQTL